MFSFPSTGPPFVRSFQIQPPAVQSFHLCDHTVSILSTPPWPESKQHDYPSHPKVSLDQSLYSPFIYIYIVSLYIHLLDDDLIVPVVLTHVVQHPIERDQFLHEVPVDVSHDVTVLDHLAQELAARFHTLG